MNLLLLRHGPAGGSAPHLYPDDSLRPLTAAGEEQLRRTADALRRLQVDVGLILSSPLTRARQTAQIIAAGLGREAALQVEPGLAPAGDRRGLIRRLAELSPAPPEVMLVGHEPDLSRLLALLTSERGDVAVALRTGGLARLQLDDRLAPQRCATLQWLVTPDQLMLMAGD